MHLQGRGEIRRQRIPGKSDVGRLYIQESELGPYDRPWGAFVVSPLLLRLHHHIFCYDNLTDRGFDTAWGAHV